jgi:hypothetical protein
VILKATTEESEQVDNMRRVSAEWWMMTAFTSVFHQCSLLKTLKKPRWTHGEDQLPDRCEIGVALVP